MLGNGTESEMQSAAFQSWRYLYHQARLSNYLSKLGMHFLCTNVLAFFFFFFLKTTNLQTAPTPGKGLMDFFAGCPKPPKANLCSGL